MADPTTPTRKDIEALVSDKTGQANQRMVRALERLFQVAGDELPANIESVVFEAVQASTMASEAVSAINRLANAIELAALEPTESNDLSADSSLALLAPAVQVGTMAYQNKDAVDITGGDVDAAGVTNCTISGGTVDSQLTDNSTDLLKSSVSLSDGAGAVIGTLTNAPYAGDPTKWVAIDDNGTTRYIPAW